MCNFCCRDLPCVLVGKQALIQYKEWFMFNIIIGCNLTSHGQHSINGLFPSRKPFVTWNQKRIYYPIFPFSSFDSFQIYYIAIVVLLFRFIKMAIVRKMLSLHIIINIIISEIGQFTLFFYQFVKLKNEFFSICSSL